MISGRDLEDSDQSRVRGHELHSLTETVLGIDVAHDVKFARGGFAMEKEIDWEDVDRPMTLLRLLWQVEAMWGSGVGPFFSTAHTRPRIGR